MTPRQKAYHRCVRKEWAKDQALRRAGVTCIFVEAEPRCAMRFNMDAAERKNAWASLGQEPETETPTTTAEGTEAAVLQPGPALPSALVGGAMGCLSLVVGTFVGALIAPHQDLRYGFLYALGPSIAAGVLMAHVHRTDPALSAKIISTTTGMRVTPVVVEQPAATAATGE